MIATLTFTVVDWQGITSPVETTLTNATDTYGALPAFGISISNVYKLADNSEAAPASLPNGTVTMLDNDAPELTCPADFSEEATSADGATVNFGITVTAAVDDSPTVTYTLEEDTEVSSGADA